MRRGLLRSMVNRLRVGAEARRTRRPGDAVVLLYHRVAVLEHDRWRLAVSPAHFEEHLALIVERFRPLSLGELAAGLEWRSVPRRSVVVTFDDGYRDNLHAAKPLLERHGVPATFFVITSYVGAARDFWWDELELLAQSAQLPDQGGHLATWRELRELPLAERRQALDALWQQAGLAPPPAASVSTAEEIISLAEGDLIEVGSHTATHARLPSLSAAAQLDEIRASKEALEELLGRPAESFSYPHGGYDRTTVACARKGGFRRACALGQRAVTTGSPPFEIPRIHVPDVPGDELERLLETHLRP